MHNSFILQQYVRYTTILDMFRAARCSSSGGQIVSLQPLVSSPFVNSRTVRRWRADCSTICMLHYDPQHVSGSTLLILRRTNCITTASGIVTLCKQPYGMRVESGLLCVRRTAPHGSPRIPATRFAVTTPGMMVRILNSVFFK